MIEVLLAFSSQNIGLSDVSSMGDTSLDEVELFGGTSEEDLDTKNAKTYVNLVFVGDEHEVTRKTLTPADKYGSIFESSNPMLEGEGAFASPMFAPRERQQQQQQQDQKLSGEELYLRQASDDSESVDGDDEDDNYNDVDSLDIAHAKHMKCQFISKRAKRRKRYTTNDTSSSNNIIPLVRERTSTKDSLDFCKMSLSEEESESRRAAGGNGGVGGHHSSGDESAMSGSGGNNNNKKLPSQRSRTRRGCAKAQRVVSLQHFHTE